MKLLFGNEKFYANFLLGLTRANYTPTLCVNPCRLVFIRVGISVERRVDSRLNKTRPVALKIWSCPIFDEQDQNVKLKGSIIQEGRRNCFHYNTVFESMGCSYHFCPCQEVRPSFTEDCIQRGCEKRHLDAFRRHHIQEKGFNDIKTWEWEW